MRALHADLVVSKLRYMGAIKNCHPDATESVTDHIVDNLGIRIVSNISVPRGVEITMSVRAAYTTGWFF